jgi:hypothetical protein
MADWLIDVVFVVFVLQRYRRPALGGLLAARDADAQGVLQGGDGEPDVSGLDVHLARRWEGGTRTGPGPVVAVRSE